MPLTDMKIRGLAKPSKATKVYDRDGLYLLSKPNGSRLFRYDCTLRGKRLTLSFGKWPTVNLAQARRMRDAAREAIELGRDPAQRQGGTGVDLPVQDAGAQRAEHPVVRRAAAAGRPHRDHSKRTACRRSPFWRSQSRWTRQSGTRPSTSAQKAGAWFISIRCATSCAAT